MSNYLALGGVSETLRALLLDRMELPQALTTGFRISIGPPRPDSVMDDKAELPRVNLFLYRVDENAALKNQAIQGRGNASAYGAPPLSLDLRYLVTAYGTAAGATNFDEIPAQFILGSAMRVLHDFPIITPEIVSVRSPIGTVLLHEVLRDEFERIKVTFEPVSLEDISKIWTALTQPYRVSAAYVVNVVQIESMRPRAFPRRVQPGPAGGARIHAVPMRTPRVSELWVHWQDDAVGVERNTAYAAIGDTLIIRGESLASPATRVRIGELDVPVGAALDDSRLALVVPDANFPDGSVIPVERRLRPGVQSLEVIGGVEGLPSTGFPSNRMAFMLTPRIAAVATNLAATPRTVTLTGSRLFDDGLSGETLLGRAVVGRDLYVSATPVQVVAPVPDALVAWRVRTLVSGAMAAVPAGLALKQLTLSIGAEAVAITISRQPANFADLALIIERGVNAAGTTPASRGLRVAVTSDNRLVLIPGGLHDAIVVHPAEAGTVLLLQGGAGGATTQFVYQSGRVTEPPGVTSAAPALTVQLNAGPVLNVALASRPASVAECAAMLEAGIRATGGAMATAWVAVSNQQLLVSFPGAPASVTFGPAPHPADATSVRELGLFNEVVLRVRVNGAETMRERTVRLTE